MRFWVTRVGNIYHALTIVPSVASLGSKGQVDMQIAHAAQPLQRAAASVLAFPLVNGPVCEAVVVAATSHGAYLLIESANTVLPILFPHSIALPTAVRIAERDARLDVEMGDVVEVGGGRIRSRVGDHPQRVGLDIQVVRAYRPARVRVDPRAVAAPGHPVPPELLARIGHGVGLTPECDDEIGGHLLVSAALGRPVPEIEPALHRTTALSASLLRAAALGYAVPAVVSYIDAVIAGHRPTAARLRPEVAAIGQSSGRALLRGIDAAVASIASARESTHPTTRRIVA